MPVDQIDPAEIPTGVAHADLAEVTVPCRNLEAHPLQRNCAIALPLAPLGFQAKGVAKRFAGGARTEHIRPLEAAQPASTKFRGARRGLLDFHPGLGRFVEQLERQLGQPSSIFKSRPSSLPQNTSCLPF